MRSLFCRLEIRLVPRESSGSRREVLRRLETLGSGKPAAGEAALDSGSSSASERFSEKTQMRVATTFLSEVADRTCKSSERLLRNVNSRASTADWRRRWIKLNRRRND